MKADKILVILAAAGALQSAWAFNTGFLKDTPVSRFNDQDVALMMATANRALDELADGKTLSWKSPQTPAAGSITPIRTLKRDGRSCRVARFKNSHGSLRNETEQTLCRDGAGAWQLRP